MAAEIAISASRMRDTRINRRIEKSNCKTKTMQLKYSHALYNIIKFRPLQQV
jgi:hypothetical protein